MAWHVNYWVKLNNEQAWHVCSNWFIIMESLYIMKQPSTMPSSSKAHFRSVMILYGIQKMSVWHTSDFVLFSTSERKSKQRKVIYNVQEIQQECSIAVHLSVKLQPTLKVKVKVIPIWLYHDRAYNLYLTQGENNKFDVNDNAIHIQCVFDEQRLICSQVIRRTLLISKNYKFWGQGDSYTIGPFSTPW